MDLNGDGSVDILSGSYSRQTSDMAGLFQVLWGQPNGTFKKATALKGIDGEPLIIPGKGNEELTRKICTRPYAVDWTGSGKLDLIVGNFEGTFYRFAGEGPGKFNPKPELIKGKGGEALRIQSAHSDPFVIDWDGDGDLDILSGSASGGVQWAENTAGRGTMPELNPFTWMIQPRDLTENGELVNEGDLKGPQGSTRVWAADLNQDGKLDLLVGDAVTLVSTAKGVSEAEFKKRHAAWQKEFTAAQQNGGEFPQKIYEKRNEFMIEDRTGYVWAYLRR